MQDDIDSFLLECGDGTGNGEEENGDWGAAAGTNKRAWLPISSSFSSIPSLRTGMGPAWKAMQGKANPWRWKADLGKVRVRTSGTRQYLHHSLDHIENRATPG
jgi:hypothetical protein